MPSEADADGVRQRTMAVARQYQSLLAQGRLDEWIDLWDEDGVLEFPFAPTRHVIAQHGKTEILAYMRAAAGGIVTDEVTELRAHPGLDPEILVVELETRGHLAETGAPYDQKYVCIFQTHGGRILRYREYWNPLISIEAHGGLDQWRASHSSQAPG